MFCKITICVNTVPPPSEDREVTLSSAGRRILKVPHISILAQRHQQNRTATDEKCDHIRHQTSPLSLTDFQIRQVE